MEIIEIQIVLNSINNIDSHPVFLRNHENGPESGKAGRISTLSCNLIRNFDNGRQNNKKIHY